MANQDDATSDSSVEEISYRNVNYEGDASSDETSSSSRSHRAPPAFPILVPIESPNLGALITAFNATSTLNRVFANNGQDLLSSLPYDPEWYRKLSEPSERNESSEEDWELSVRVDLQVLSAFLDGKFARNVASTANLESLLRLKVSRMEEPYLGISTLFKLFIQIPGIHQAIMQFADVEESRVAVLPVPIDIDDYWGSLQGAADRIFWPSIIRYTEGSEPDAEQIPVLDNLCEVLVIQCQQPEIEPDKEIWPERYTAKYRDVVLKKWQDQHDHYRSITRLETELDSRSIVDGKLVTESLKLSISSLAEEGLESAAVELSDKLSKLELEHSDLRTRITSLKQTKGNEDGEDPIVPIDPAEMTPYELKSLILMENYSEPGIVITRNPANPTEWRYVHGSTTRILEWSDVLFSTQKFENYLAFYERKKEDTPSKVATSILNFAKDDSVEFSKSAEEIFDYSDSDASSRADVQIEPNSDESHENRADRHAEAPGMPDTQTIDSQDDRAKSADFDFY